MQKVKELIEPLLETHRNPRFLFNLVLKAFANTGDLPGADAWYLRMLKSRVAVSGRTFGKLLKCAAKAGAAEAAEGWLRRAAAGGFQVSVPQLVSLVEAFARAQDGHRGPGLAATTGRNGWSTWKPWKPWKNRGGGGCQFDGLGAPGRFEESCAEHLTIEDEVGKIQWIAMLDACAKSSLVTPCHTLPAFPALNVFFGHFRLKAKLEHILYCRLVLYFVFRASL